jgi:hypothetical protein
MGKLHGEGRFFVLGGSYSISGTFNQGLPTISANKYLISILSPAEAEEDPKAKKDPKKPAAVVEEEDLQGCDMKVSVDL